jgi:hypothetical protein
MVRTPEEKQSHPADIYMPKLRQLDDYYHSMPLNRMLLMNLPREATEAQVNGLFASK